MNAKEEFISVTKDLEVICASIQFGYMNPQEPILLKTGYTQEQYNEFLNKLNIDYDSGYGGQELYGIIYCKDNIWLDRAEYDGSEWWDEHKYPLIPDELKEQA